VFFIPLLEIRKLSYTDAMMNIRSHGAVVVAAVVAFLAATAAGAASKPVNLQLKLPAKPAFPPPEMAALLTAGPLSLGVVDARGVDDPTIVGAQREKGQDVYFWRVVTPIVPEVTALVTKLLNDWSIHVGPESEFGLLVELANYYVNEKSETFGSTYVAEVRLKLKLTDRAGNTLWSGEGKGDAKRPGVDGRAAMFNEAMSIALRAALAQGLSAVKLETAVPSAAAPVVAAPASAPSIAIEPDALLADLTRLKADGVADDVLVAYVEQRRLSRPLTVDEILSWKNAGIPDAAIKAAK
jgi:hypothetical protein